MSGCSIIYFKGCISFYEVFVLANSAYPDEMLQNMAFNLGFLCLYKYPNS